MKPKDVNFFTQHVEKFILGAGVFVLLIVCLLFVFGSPYAVEVTADGAKQSAGPAQIEKLVRNEAEQLDRELGRGVNVPKTVIADYVDDFNQAYTQRIHSLAQFARWGDRSSPKRMNAGPAQDTEYKLPHPPMPVSVTARAGHGVLNFSQVKRKNKSRLRELVGNEQPADFRYVSVSGTFDKASWAKRFRKIPVENRVPDRIYHNSLFVTGVYLLRQAKDPISGQWTDMTVISPLPGQLGFYSAKPKDLTPVSGSTSYSKSQARQAKQTLRRDERQITRPDFPPLWGVNPWVPPGASNSGLTRDERNRLFQINKKIRQLEDHIQELKKRGENQANDNGPTAAERLDRRRRERNRDGNDREESRRRQLQRQRDRDRNRRREEPESRPRRDSGSSSQDRVQARVEQLNQQIIQLRQQRDELQPQASEDRSDRGREAEMRGRGRGAEAGGRSDYQNLREDRARREAMERSRRGQGRGRGRGGRRRRGGDEGQAEDSSRVEIWAHDLTVQPDRTYRYKIVAAALNPLFHQGGLTDKQKAKNKNRIALAPTVDEIASAKWSEPVYVAPKYYFYLVGGSPGQNRAEVEVYRLFGGQWRMQTFNVQPGDSIGNVVEIDGPEGASRVDMRVGALMVDMQNVAGAGGEKVRMLYLDPITDRIKSRAVTPDRNNPQRQRLHSLSQRRAEAGGP